MTDAPENPLSGIGCLHQEIASKVRRTVLVESYESVRVVNQQMTKPKEASQRICLKKVKYEAADLPTHHYCANQPPTCLDPRQDTMLELHHVNSKGLPMPKLPFTLQRQRQRQ